MPDTTEPTLVECHMCGDDFDESGMIYSPDDMPACEDCIADATSHCEWCNEYVWHEDTTYLQDSNESICMRCVDYETSTCERCGTIQHNDDIWYTDWDAAYCRACYEETEEENWVRRWGDKPDPEFIGAYGEVSSVSYTPTRGQWYMGMEIEVEAGNGPMLQELFQDRHAEVGHVYYTTDSSLSYGLEIVTHPGTFEAWRKGMVLDWDKWKEIVHDQVPDQSKFNSNGIHIHVSRDAFNNKKGIYSAAHVYKFLHFFQHHKDAVQTIAGRGEQQYCRWDFTRDLRYRMEDAKRKDGTRYDRYRPVNTNNTHTIEMRMFDGRTDKPFIMRAIEFIHAVVEYTRHTSKLTSWPDFDAYVTEHKDIYPYLEDFLQSDRDLLILAQANQIINKRQVKQVYAEVKAERERMRREERDAARRRSMLQESSNAYEEWVDAAPDRCDCPMCVDR